jgi:hypothetical protein
MKNNEAAADERASCCCSSLPSSSSTIPSTSMFKKPITLQQRRPLKRVEVKQLIADVTRQFPTLQEPAAPQPEPEQQPSTATATTTTSRIQQLFPDGNNTRIEMSRVGGSRCVVYSVVSATSSSVPLFFDPDARRSFLPTCMSHVRMAPSAHSLVLLTRRMLLLVSVRPLDASSIAAIHVCQCQRHGVSRARSWYVGHRHCIASHRIASQRY